ncbi:TetR family transcriptional regulator [Sphingobium sp.]|uniref:TetR family transcriptional regulator n=1 Tax=Sphingobium sp. TaxID=1912891 RepID=UPI003B3BA5FF
MADSRNRDQRDNRLEIVEAAAQAFMREGFASTSVDHIAHLLGSTKGRVYYYFKNKTELFFAVHEETINTNLAHMLPLVEAQDGPVEKMEKMVGRHIDAILQRLPFQRVSLMGLEMQIIGRTTPEEREILDGLIQRYREYEGLFLGVVEQGMQDGLFEKGDASIIVKSILGAMNWMIMWYRPRGEGDDKHGQRIRKSMTEYVMNGLVKKG